MEKENLLIYEFPMVEVIEVEVEKGYATSTEMEGWEDVEEW